MEVAVGCLCARKPRAIGGSPMTVPQFAVRGSADTAAVISVRDNAGKISDQCPAVPRAKLFQ
jgi:hypothetical protein